MPTYKGNRGNLLQHWVLAEFTMMLQESVQPKGPLCFIDAHAMSPYAVRNANPGQTAADFDRVAGRLPGQLSTYSANNANSQADVIKSIEPILAVAGLELAATVRADGNMMSLVFVRGVAQIREAQLPKLPQRFTAWLEQALAPRALR